MHASPHVPAGLSALVGAGGGAWPSLHSLELQACGISAAGLQALAVSPQAGCVAVLHLEANPLGPAAGQPLGDLVRVGG